LSMQVYFQSHPEAVAVDSAHSAPPKVWAVVHWAFVGSLLFPPQVTVPSEVNWAKHFCVGHVIGGKLQVKSAFCVQREAIREAEVWVREVEETVPARGEEKREAGRSAATDGQGHLDEPQVGTPTEASQAKLQPPGKQSLEVHWQEVADVPVHLQAGAAAVE